MLHSEAAPGFTIQEGHAATMGSSAGAGAATGRRSTSSYRPITLNKPRPRSGDQAVARHRWSVCLDVTAPHLSDGLR